MIYRSAAGRASVNDAYTNWLSNVPTGLASLAVPTRYGDAHVVSANRLDPEPQRPAVVALPGTNFPALAWACLFEPSLRGHRVLALDLIGQPGCTQGPRQHAGENVVSWLDDVFDALQLPEATLVGHSLGSHIALQFAAARPLRTQGLALVCPAGLMRLRVPVPVLTRTTAWMAHPSPTTSRALLKQMSETGGHIEDLVEWMTAVGRHVRMSLAPRPLPAQVLRQVTCPVVVIAGERDPFLPGQRLAKATARRLPAASTVVIAGGRHLLPHDRPKQVADLIARFVQQTGHEQRGPSQCATVRPSPHRP